MSNNLRLGPRGEQLIKSFEQLRLTAYRPTRNDVWTIGWGSTQDVHEGLSITIDQAQLRFIADTFDAIRYANALPCALTQSMFDALISLVFNAGPSSIKAGSTIGNALHLQAAGGYPSGYFAAWAGFALWRKQAGKDLLGLARRRAKEMDLFLADGLP
jgi:GH24 family phage-related lysozyme (muramidase)